MPPLSTQSSRQSSTTNSTNSGSLVCVGTGLRLAGQLTPIAKSHIENADIVLGAVASTLSRQWLREIAKEYVCLLSFYGDGDENSKARNITYRQMADRILTEVRAGKTVCAAFYGHPGVFACISHMAIEDARTAGYPAQMLPGISAEDCLVADLGIDPGAKGMQSMEATQFLVFQRVIDPTSLFILWQPGIVGDLSMKRFTTSEQHLQLLVEKLSRYYSLDHQVILYEAATNPIEQTRQETISLKDLSTTALKQITTLVIPPTAELVYDQLFVDKINALG